LACRARTLVVENLDFDQLRAEQPRKTRLTAPVTPSPAHDSRGDRKPDTELQGAVDNSDDATIIPLKPDERTCV
jgi:hypothetical protein